MSEPIAYYNGQFIAQADLAVEVYDAGFVLGTTISEQLRTFAGRLFRLDQHLDRLFHSLDVVGVDGSPQSAHALRWALDHVQRTAVVTAVQVTTAGPIPGEPLSPDASEIEAAARRELEALVAAVVAEAEGHPEVDPLVVSGDPREELGSAVAGTDLLVVGARGHGMIHRLLLGSVAMALVHHPTLPTIVVPHGQA